MERFSRENINSKLKFINPVSPFEPFKRLVGLLIDIGPYIGFWGSIGLFVISQHILFLVGIVFFGVLTIIFLYLNNVRFHNFKVNEFEIPMRGIQKTFEFIFVSDLHFGPERTAGKDNKLTKLIDFINSTKIQTVVFGGDYVYEIIDKKIFDRFAEIKAQNKLAVYGNHESLYLREKQDVEEPIKFYEAFKDSSFKLLINESVKIGEITFGGVPDLFSKNFDLVKTFSKSDSSERVLISHNPDIFDFVEESDQISLILSGHNHAGHISLPWIGPVIPMPSKHRWMQRGLYSLPGKPQLFMSQGLGAGSLKTRIGTDYEVCIIKLVPALKLPQVNFGL